MFRAMTKNIFTFNRGDYYVVEFKDGEEVAVVPKNWLRGKEKCLWPSWKSEARTDKAIRNKEEPDSSFSFYEIQRIMYQTDSYSKALQKVKQAEQLSDLQTEEEDLAINGKRKRRPNLRYASDDSTPEKSTRRKRTMSSSPEATPTSKKRFGPLPDLGSVPTPPRAPPMPRAQSSPKRYSLVKRALQQKSPDTSTLPTPLATTRVSATEKKMLELLEDIRSSTRNNTLQLQKITKSLTQMESDGSGTELPEGIVLPLSTLADFQRLEDLLENQAVSSKVAIHLGTIGGDNVKECTRRILRYCFTTNLSVMFNWRGQGDKKAFGDSRMAVVVRKAVRRNRLTVSASDNDIDSVIKDWFRYAKDCDGGRKKRSEKQNHATEHDVPQNLPADDV